MVLVASGELDERSGELSVLPTFEVAIQWRLAREA